jgi:hypothetical protein
MGKRLVSIVVALALITPTSFVSAASKSPKLAKCDSKKRRPANPYGSILPSVDPVAGTSTPAAESSADGQGRKGVEVFPQKPSGAAKPAKPDSRPNEQVPPISGFVSPSTERSC